MATTAPDDELPRGIARLWGVDGRVTGSGFLIAERTLCTCAHVVASALGTGETDATRPSASVTLDFPLLTTPSARLGATVTHWRPVTADGGGDIALLHLSEAVPGTTPVRFAGGTAVWDHAFRVLGFPSHTDDHGVWVDGRLRAPVGKGWTSMEARPSPGGPSIGCGFSGGPVWDTEQGGVVGMTVAAETGTGATTAYLIPAASLLGLDPMLCPSPFRGLEPFREEDAAIFFARRTDGERIAEALRGHAFVPVAGASGVGKSSLVRAGVLPLLRAAGHTVTDFAGQPDVDPVRTLAEALTGQFPQVRDLAHLLPRDRESATLLGARVLEQCGPAGHVILLDQFEETVGARPADARALLDVILPMTRATHPTGRRLRALATLRSASLEELVSDGRAEDLSGTVQMIAPMTPAQLDEVVRRPVDAAPGVEFEPGLAELVVTDAGTEPGALPLVEFALAELWDRREHGRLTHAAYREIGGVEGALSRYADHQLARVRKAPDGPDEATARRLFERLARPVKGKEYARVARAFDSLPPELRTAAQALAGTRLLVIARDSSGRETVALAHEALVRQWPTLRGWLDASREFLAWHEKLRGRLREWEEGQRHTDLLLPGGEVAVARSREAERPEEITEAEGEFIGLSRRHRRRALRRGRTAVALVACLALLAAGLSVVALKLVRGGAKSDERAAARDLAGYAESRAAEDPVAAALLALGARRTSDVPEADRAVLRTALPLSRLVAVRRVLSDGESVATAASADGRTFAVLAKMKEGKAQVVVLRLGTDGSVVEEARPRGVRDQAETVAVSDDGTRLAVGGRDGWVTVWRTGRPDPVDGWHWHPAGGNWGGSVLDFSARGDLLLHGSGVGPSACDTGEADGLWYIRDLAHDTRRFLPEGIFRFGECVKTAALPAAGEAGRVEVVTSQSVVAAQMSYDLYRLQDGPLSGSADGALHRSAVLGTAVLGPGGRLTARRSEGATAWTARVSGSKEYRSRADFESEEAPLEASGRFAAIVEAGESDDPRTTMGREDRDAMPLVLEDGRTRKRYRTVVPSGISTGRVSVVPGTRGRTPLVFAVQGRDVLVFSTVETDHPLYEKAKGVRGVAYGPSGERLVELVSYMKQVDHVGKEETYLLVRRAGGKALVRPLRGMAGGGGVVVGADRRHIMVWDSDWWQMRNLSDLRYRAGEPASDAEFPYLGVGTVSPLGRKDFLLLDASGLSRVRGDDGKKTRLSRLGCPADGTGTDPRVCVAAAELPGHDEIVIVRRNGQTELRGPNGERRGPKVSLGPLADDMTGRDLVLSPDGQVVALSTAEGVTLWWPGTQRTKDLATGARAFGPFRADHGTLVVARRTLVGTETQQSLELWDTRRGELVAPLHLWSPWQALRVGKGEVSAESDLGRTTLSLGPLLGRPDGLCAVLADYPLTDLKDLLKHDEKVSGAPDTRQPCRHR